MKRLLFLVLLLSTLSCTKSTKEYIDDGDFKFWYIKYSDSYVTNIYYLGNNGVCKYFWLYPGGGFEAYKISDIILIEKWRLKGDSIIEIGGNERLMLQGAPDKPCGGGHTDANSKTVAIRYMIENKLVPLHYES